MQAFVAMPFNPVFLGVWKAIKRSCENNGIKPCRVDQLPQVDDIHKAIFTEIEKSDLIIVDFSGDKLLSVPNPNVVTEATHAKGLKKPIVILTQSIESLPFDWRTHRAIVYKNDVTGMEYITEVLTENLSGIKERCTGTSETTTKPGMRIQALKGFEFIGTNEFKCKNLSNIAKTGTTIQAPKGFEFLCEATYTCGNMSNTMQEFKHIQTGMEFVYIPGGSFNMGSNDDDKEKPIHKVTLSPFLMAKYQCTQVIWEKVMGSNPSQIKTNPKNPVERVSWDDCQKFCEKTGLQLPSESQWEYACRAGSTGKWYFGDDESKLGEYEWYDENSGYQMLLTTPYSFMSSKEEFLYYEKNRPNHPVGQLKPNAYGLYDMSGNVSEWCQDLCQNNYNGAPADGSAWTKYLLSYRVYRSGTSVSSAVDCRSASRCWMSPDSHHSWLGVRFSLRL